MDIRQDYYGIIIVDFKLSRYSPHVDLDDSASAQNLMMPAQNIKGWYKGHERCPWINIRGDVILLGISPYKLKEKE